MTGKDSNTGRGLSWQRIIRSLLVLIVGPGLLYAGLQWGCNESLGYRQRTRESEVKKLIKDLATCQEAYHAEFNRYTDKVSDLEKLGFVANPRIKLVVVLDKSGGQFAYVAAARHMYGGRVASWGNGCNAPLNRPEPPLDDPWGLWRCSPQPPDFEAGTRERMLRLLSE